MKRYTKQWNDQVETFNRLRLNLSENDNARLDSIQNDLKMMIARASESVTVGYNAEEVKEAQ